jgi:hypothetical protein
MTILLQAVVGVVFGWVLAGVRFTSWHEVQAMFAFRDLRLLLTFGLAVMLLAAAWRVILRVAPGHAPAPLIPARRRHVVGGLIFGVGWALSGACPSIALAGLGAGSLASLAILGGVLVGSWMWGQIGRRFFPDWQDGCSTSSN